jgi:hypothetical protein
MPATREAIAATELAAWAFSGWPKVWTCVSCEASYLIREVTVRCRVCGFREDT